MAYLLTDLAAWYHDLMDNRSDPRVQDWPMMSSPLPTLGLCIFYAYFSKVLGPRIMAKREPLNLRKILIVYNFFQTIFSAWIFYEYLRSGWWGHYSFKCQPVDYSRSPLAMRMANTCWWYYIAKFTEFFDTLFFILRKKMNHVSTLHVIHHGCMPFSVWMGMKFAPGGHSTFFAMLNSFVHIVMYFYYMVAAMGPKYQKYIWWKKYLTTFQMVQFVAIFTHQFQLLFRDCDYPKGFMVWIGLHGIMFLFLFSDFYKAKYSRRTAAAVANKGAAHKLNGAAANGTSQNQGACMPVLNDDDLAGQQVKTSKTNGFHDELSGGKRNGLAGNGHILNGYDYESKNNNNTMHEANNNNSNNNGLMKNGIRNGFAGDHQARKRQ